MFDLEKAIVQWRKSLAQRRSFTKDDLDELEAHVRDHVAALEAEGIDQKVAFGRAVRRMGDTTTVASEYRKIVWTKARKRGRLIEAGISEFSMLANYGKVGFRNLMRHKAYSLINIVGLGVGLACCLLIWIYIQHELSFDRHHEHVDRIQRVTRVWNDETDVPVLELPRISMPIGPALEREIPEVERVVRLFAFEAPIAVANARFIESNIFVADSSFFDIFSAKITQGDPEHPLVEPHTVIITDEVAQRYFGSLNPIGQPLVLFDEYELEVTGVMESQPLTSHFHPDFLISFGTTNSWTSPADRSDWGQYNNYATYLLLSPEANAETVQAKLPAFLRSHFEGDNNAQDALLLQPLSGIHLDSKLEGEFEPGGNRGYVYLFGAVAAFILLIGCFNFINLATARSSHRGKEVGMRKVLGADRSQLVRQYLGESGIITVLALLLGIVITIAAFPEFTHLSGQAISWSDIDLSTLAFGGLTIGLIVALLSGAYPALYMSRIRPSEILRGTIGGSWRSRLRSTLVVLQFAISIALVVGMTTVQRQVSFLQDKDLGFEKESLVILPATDEMRVDFDRYRNQLLASPAIKSVTASRLVPARPLVDHVGVSATVNGAQKQASIALNPVDHHFVDTYGMQMLAGRSFDTDIASDSTEAYVINESAVRHLGWNSADEAIGQPFALEARSFTRPGTVIGVVKDFHFETVKQQISPLVLFIMPERYRRVTVRIQTARVDEALAFLEAKWAEYRPGYPFTYSFVDADFGALYESEKRVGVLFGYFTVIGLMIALLGLLGLASFVLERRRKEISVRKVLGASVSTIVGMLSTDFLRLVGISFLVACPFAYIVLDWWLQRFAYRIDLGPWVFVMAGLGVAAIALIAIGWQSIRGAMSDPVMSLKEN